MTRRIITVPGRRYTDSPDVAVPDGDRMWALVEARLVDELTMQPVVTPVHAWPAGAAFALASARRAVRARAADGGIVGLVGLPRQVMPRLRTTNYELGLSVAADGYVPTTRTAFLGPVNTFPGVFTPLPLGDVQLHRTGLQIRGRVMFRKPNGDLDVANNANVSLTSIWRRMPTLTVPVPPQPPNVLALSVPLYADRLTATDSVRPTTLNANMPAFKRLARPAAAGDRVLYLTDRAGIAANPVLGIDRPDAERVEHVVVTAVDPSVPVTAAGTATLAYPLALAHAAGAPVVPVTPVPAGGTVNLALDAIAGDTSLILASMAGLGAPVPVEISGSGVREFHSAAPPIATTNGEGFYRLPPIARVAQLRMRFDFGALAPEFEIVALDYSAREQRVDVVFP